jgi:hypothetical protein
MKVQINYADIEGSTALAEHVERSIEAALPGSIGERVTRIEVHLRDDKGGRSGPDDMRCLMEYRLAGEHPDVVDARGGDIYDVVRECADKLGRAVTRKVERS